MCKIYDWSFNVDWVGNCENMHDNDGDDHEDEEEDFYDYV